MNGDAKNGKLSHVDPLIGFKPTFISKKERERRKKEQEDKEQKEKEEQIKLLEKKNKLYSRGLTGDELQDRLNGKLQVFPVNSLACLSQSKPCDCCRALNCFLGKSRSGDLRDTSTRASSEPSKDRRRDEKLKDKQNEETPITSREIEAIKNTKLGIVKQRKKLQKPSEKFRKIYVDDWNPEDDTSIDINPLYQNRYQPKILFGKGTIGGIDPEEQKVDKVRFKNLIFCNRYCVKMFTNLTQSYIGLKKQR